MLIEFMDTFKVICWRGPRRLSIVRGENLRQDRIFTPWQKYLLIGNSIEGLPIAEIMPEKLAGGISVVKVKFLLTALCGEAVRWL